MKIKRMVVCVYGKFGKDTDFILEPVCNDPECDCCNDGFWIEAEVNDDNKRR